MDSKTLYQHLLGRDFDRLPAVLHRFHGLPTGGQATGTLTVKHGKGLIRHWAAWLLRLPRPGENIPVRVQVRVKGRNEIWIRHFGRQCIRTVQWQEDGYLIEKAGPLCFVFKVRGDEQGLRFDFQHNRLMGIKLPYLISLRADAIAEGTGDSWQITVNITSPLLGVLASYRGRVHPLPE
jgi:hypothetical protein